MALDTTASPCIYSVARHAASASVEADREETVDLENAGLMLAYLYMYQDDPALDGMRAAA